jgi:hypothetical protein
MSIFLITNNQVYIILISQLFGTILYFLTLLVDVNNDDKLKNIILKNSTLTKRILYYLISAIWILVPLYLLSI